MQKKNELSIRFIYFSLKEYRGERKYYKVKIIENCSIFIAVRYSICVKFSYLFSKKSYYYPYFKYIVIISTYINI